MGDFKVSLKIGGHERALDMYFVDFAHSVMNAFPEIPIGEMGELKEFIQNITKPPFGNAGLIDILVRGVGPLYLIWREVKDWDKFRDRLVVQLKEALDKHGCVP